MQGETKNANGILKDPETFSDWLKICGLFWFGFFLLTTALTARYRLPISELLSLSMIPIPLVGLYAVPSLYFRYLTVHRVDSNLLEGCRAVFLAVFPAGFASYKLQAQVLKVVIALPWKAVSPFQPAWVGTTTLFAGFFVIALLYRLSRPLAGEA